MAHRSTTRASREERAPRLRAVPPRESGETRSAVDDVTTSAPRSAGTPRPTRRARLTLILVAAWLAVAGVALAGFVPAAGLVCLVAAAVSGLLAALVPSHEVVPERTAEPPEG